tara:strand:- start:215 stop:352 length:138 start_codon:yes stop_codon:yes gene_type:complete
VFLFFSTVEPGGGGTPEEAAEKLRENPEHTLRDYFRFLGDVKEKR